MASLSASGSTNRSGSRSGLSGVFKSRRERRTKGVASNASAASSDVALDGHRSSVDATLDKLRDMVGGDGERKNSADSGRRMSSILRRHSKKKKKDRGAEASGGEVNRVDSAGMYSAASLDVDALPGRQNASDDSLVLHKSVASSLLTEDSDHDSKPVRPSLTPRHSHTGYLTLSSPLITHEKVDPSPTESSRHSSGNELSASHPLERPASIHRAPSPAQKLKEAFSPAKKTADSKPAAESDGPRRGSSALLEVAKKTPSGSRRGSRVLDEAQAQESADKSSSSRKAGKKAQATPQIVTTLPSTPPAASEAQQITTLITPPTPTERPETAPTEGASKGLPSNLFVSPTGMLSHRRTRSATSPSNKLASTIVAPLLSPTPEELKTPGGTFTAPAPSGFFNSVFSAAQNAANQFTNSINTSIGSGPKPPKGAGLPTGSDEPEKPEDGGVEVIGGATDAPQEEGEQRRPLAVETLGSGDLSLSHLGIIDASDPSPMSSRVDLADPPSRAPQNDHDSARAEDSAAAQAVSAAYSAEKPPLPPTDRPRSINSASGTQTPPRPTDGDATSIKRSGSMRSRISGGQRRRKRHGSNATGNTIAAAISATHNTVASPTAQVHGQRMTGIAVASAKRNRDFHQLFRSVPEDDFLIEDYSAALQKEILLQGRFYVSEGHICFYSNIVGWVTNMVISFDEVVSIEKVYTAMIIPNAIAIQTLHARNVFRSFVTRDSTYDLLINIWKVSHPNLKSSVNGVTIDNSGTGERAEKTDSESGSDEGSSLGSDEVYDEDEDEDAARSFSDAGDVSIAGSELSNVKKEVIRKPSASAVTTSVSNGSAKLVETVEAVVAAAASSTEFPGPTTHGPTDCGDEATHYDKVVMDATIAAPLGKIYSMMFGPSSSTFMRKWLIEDQKSQDLQMEDDKKGLGEDKKTRSFSYIKPLSGSIGPKQTKCMISETLDQFDLDKVVSVSCSTQNPDVPNGNIFVVKTKYCLTWAPGNATRLVMNCTIEWSGKSWIKGPIEKGANDGQTQYAKDLVSALQNAVASKAVVKASGKLKSRGKKKRSPTDGTAGETGAGSGASASARSQQQKSDWGLLEPLHGLFGPVVDLLGPLASAPVVITLLSVLVVFLWLRLPGRGTVGAHLAGSPRLSAPQRLAAYEEIWRKEESELWDWLEERVAMDRAAQILTPGGDDWKHRQRERDLGSRLRDEAMSDRQVEEAIRVTQERLDSLRSVVDRKRRKEEGVKGA